MRSRRRLRAPVLALAAVLALWLAGLVWFANGVPRRLADATTPTDAVVVLTGGSLRLENGVAVLRGGMAKKLFVSGVYHGVDVAEILRLARDAPDWIACCIALGYAADNTLGNAVETAAWMRRENFRSLRLVTANYHMRRSLLEFARVMPEVAIVPHPVFPEHVKAQWWAWPGTLSLIVGEYHKYLAALARPLFPASPPA